MKRRLKRKMWLDNRAIRILARRSKRPQKSKRPNKAVNNLYKAVAPANFSLVSNPEESICFFETIVSEMCKRDFNKLFFIDLSLVEHMTTDCVMYMIALLNNLKSAVFKYRFSGNVPESENARRLLKESGFLNYVNSADRNVYSNSKKIQIKSGRDVSTNTAREICDFVNNIFSTDRIFTFKLYKTIIELMTNTHQHAYKEKAQSCLPVNNWYIFVELVNDTINFVFLDTGEGIPTTIKRRLIERVYSLDSKLIKSVLHGDFRTETSDRNRGKGLPMIYSFCKDRYFSEFRILSRCGSLEIDSELHESSNDYSSPILGTLFNWHICMPTKEDSA